MEDCSGCHFICVRDTIQYNSANLRNIGAQTKEGVELDGFQQPHLWCKYRTFMYGICNSAIICVRVVPVIAQIKASEDPTIFARYIVEMLFHKMYHIS